MEYEKKKCANPNCGKEFTPKMSKQIYCCEACHRQGVYINDREKRMKKLLEEGIEGVDYVIDKWNGLPTPRIYGKWFKVMHPDRSYDEYKAEFPDAPSSCSKDAYRTTVNSGKFMKKEKYRKMFSEKFKGEKNPRHHSRVSEQEIRENSPYCEEFYIKRGLDSSWMEAANQKSIDNRTPDKCSTRIEFYLAKGMNLQEAADALSERQRTFTLEKCIEKYGKEEGERIFMERQVKWKNSMYNGDPTCKTASSVSNIGMKFVHDVIDVLDEEYINNNLYYGDHEYMIEGSHLFCYDLTNTETNRIVEFNGDLWHGNPKKFSEDDVNNLNHQIYGDKWAYDADKISTAQNNGFEVMVVWECDYHIFKDGIVERARDFLLGKNVDISDMCNVRYPEDNDTYKVLNELYEKRS